MERPVIHSVSSTPCLLLLDIGWYYYFCPFTVSTHLTCDIPVNESNPSTAPPDLPNHGWGMPTMPTMQENYDLFKE